MKGWVHIPNALRRRFIDVGAIPIEPSFYRAHNHVRVRGRFGASVHFALIGQWRGLEPSAAFQTDQAARALAAVDSTRRSVWGAIARRRSLPPVRFHSMQITEPSGMFAAGQAPESILGWLVMGMPSDVAGRCVHPAFWNHPVGAVTMRDAEILFGGIADARRDLGPPIIIRSDVVVVNGDDQCPPCTQYRVVNPASVLRNSGLRVVVVSASDLHRLRGCMVESPVVLIYRALPTTDLQYFLEHQTPRHAVHVFDIDDLLFDGPRPLCVLQAGDTPGTRLDGGGAVTTRLAMADVARMARVRTAPTVDLAAMFQASIPGAVAVLPPVLSAEQLETGERVAHAQRPRSGVVIGYSAGTGTHGEDFQVVVPALAAILREFPEASVLVLGALNPYAFGLPRDRVAHDARVTSDWQELMARMQAFDINVVPLQAENAYCRSKSEVKYLEAACLGIPTVASAVPAYERALTGAGITGALVRSPRDWKMELRRLVSRADDRSSLGEAARQDAVTRYGPNGAHSRAYESFVRGVSAGESPDDAPDWPAVLGCRQPEGDSRDDITLVLVGRGVGQVESDETLMRRAGRRIAGRTVLVAADGPHLPKWADEADGAWCRGDSWADLATAGRRARRIVIMGNPRADFLAVACGAVQR